jgi:histidinol-phosphate/aromatic aminotransferase/cobyric acid decarboxylase-like protein
MDHVAARVAEGFDAVVLANPNSPTGTLLSRSDLTALFIHFPGTRFWVDEAYVEFAGTDNSVEQFACRAENAFVCKSMSKVYALSGLRAAYLLGPEAEIAELRKLAPPWAVSLLAQVAAVAALSAGATYNAQYRRTAELRKQLATWLQERCGLDVFPSVANFLLCELSAGAASAAEIVRRARKHKVFLRTGESIHPSLGPRTIRIAVKTEEMNQRIIEVLAPLVRKARSASRQTTSD